MILSSKMYCGQVSWLWLTLLLSDVRYGPCLQPRILYNVVYAQINVTNDSKYIRKPYECNLESLHSESMRYLQLSSFKCKYTTNTRPKWSQILSNIGTISFSNIRSIHVFSVNSFPKPCIEPMYQPSLIFPVPNYQNQITYLFHDHFAIVQVEGFE